MSIPQRDSRSATCRSWVESANASATISRSQNLPFCGVPPPRWQRRAAAAVRVAIGNRSSTSPQPSAAGLFSGEAAEAPAPLSARSNLLLALVATRSARRWSALTAGAVARRGANAEQHAQQPSVIVAPMPGCAGRQSS